MGNLYECMILYISLYYCFLIVFVETELTNHNLFPYQIYGFVAEWLTELELNRTQTEFDDSLSLKIYLLQVFVWIHLKQGCTTELSWCAEKNLRVRGGLLTLKCDSRRLFPSNCGFSIDMSLRPLY